MAIRLSDFRKSTYKAMGKTIDIQYLYESLEEDKMKGCKYLGRFRVGEKQYSKVIGYSKKNGKIALSPKDAGKKVAAYKDEIEAGYKNNNINLNKLFDLYYETLDTSKQWTSKKKYIYEHYIEGHLGKKKIESIKEMDVQKLLNQMVSKGLSPRTRKSILEVLNPLFRFSVINKYLRSSPTDGITVKVPSQKKIVINATDLFQKVYVGINAYYHDDPFYRALFLFGFTGRRKSEILNLKWENIDFKNNYYWIEDTKTDDQQKYQLPSYLVEPLQAIIDNRKGLVFKSLITGKKIINIDRQMRQLKKFLELETLSMHYMRNILVSALAEQGVEAITLTGILGHKDPNTINKYLSINHYKSSQIGLNKVDEIIDIEVEDD